MRLEYSRLIGDLLAYIRQESGAGALPERKAKLPVQKTAKQAQPSVPVKQVLPPATPQKISSPSPPLPKTQGQSPFTTLIPRALGGLRLATQIPSDAEAVALTELYKKKAPQVALLYLSKEELPFFEALAKAIQERLVPAKIWPAAEFKAVAGLRLILVTHAATDTLAVLKAHFHPSPEPRLLGVPCILLSRIEDYEQNGALKRSLWQHVRQFFP